MSELPVPVFKKLNCIVPERSYSESQGVSAAFHTVHRSRGDEALGKNFLSSLLTAKLNRRHANVLAASLLGHFGSLVGVLAANIDDIAAVPGVGRENATAVKLSYSIIVDVANSCMLAKQKPDQSAIINLAVWTIGESQVEKVLLIYLDKMGRFMGHEMVCSGSEGNVSVSPRLIVSAACRKGAAALVIAHNHPGGSVEPSDEDLILTRKLVNAANVLEIKIADHIVVSGSEHFSFREVGFL